MSGPPSYPKGDLRRMLVVLAAIAELRRNATLVQIVAATGLDKKTVTHLVAQARAQAGVDISKEGPVYRILSWGTVLRPGGAKRALASPISGKQLPRPKQSRR